MEVPFDPRAAQIARPRLPDQEGGNSYIRGTPPDPRQRGFTLLGAPPSAAY